MGLNWIMDIGSVDQLVVGERLSGDDLDGLDIWRMGFESTLDVLDCVHCYDYRYCHFHYHHD